MSKQIYLGAYVSIPKQQQLVAKVSRKCSSQGCIGKTPKNANFCMQCGMPMVDQKDITAKPHYSTTFWNAIFPNDNENLCSFDPENYQWRDRFIYLPNCPKGNMDVIQIRIDEDGIYQMPTDIDMGRAKAAFEVDYHHEVEILKATVGEYNVWIEYGLLIYDW